jgi:hypothetical protein
MGYGCNKKKQLKKNVVAEEKISRLSWHSQKLILANCLSPEKV